MRDRSRRRAPAEGPPHWPAFALLVPVLILGCVAMLAMMRDWRGARTEASSRAQELAAEVARRFERMFDASDPMNLRKSAFPLGRAVDRFVIGESNRLISPVPNRWPPDPRPFTTGLTEVKKEQWVRARKALASKDWLEAVEAYEAFLGGRLGMGNTERGRDGDDGIGDPDYRANALYERALALEGAGRSEGLPNEFQRVLGGMSEDDEEPDVGMFAMTEAGVAVGNLAALRIVELAQGDAARLPAAWRVQAHRLGRIFSRWPESPFLETLMERLTPMGKDLLPDSATDMADRLRQERERAERERSRHAQGMAQMGKGKPWPEAFWLGDTRPGWLLLRQPASGPGDAAGDGFRRVYWVVLDEWILGDLREARRTVDRKEEFELHLEIAGRLLEPWGETGRRPLPEETLATQRRKIREELEFQVHVRLANAAGYFAGQRRRQVWLGTLLGVSLAGALTSTWATRRALWRQHQLNAAKSNFVSSVSHELRAPLGSIRLLAEGLERGTVTDESRRREYVQLIGQETRRLGALVENVLNFSRIEQGRKKYEFEPTDLGAMVRETVRLFGEVSAARRVKLDLTVDPGTEASNPWELEADGRAVQQALLNLLDNAWKHSPDDSTLDVVLRRSPGTGGGSGAVEISVRDRGPGIPENDHERIFEPFYRRGSELRRETEGVGIGLSLVRHVMLAHGGRVTVDSTAGKGARFTLILPARPKGTAGAGGPPLKDSETSA